MNNAKLINNRISLRIFFAAIGITLLTSCVRLPEKYLISASAPINAATYQRALKILQANKRQYTGSNELLYYLEEGMLLHLSLNYEKSIRSFENAKTLYEQLYTKSISRISASWMANDYTLPYSGEDFERVLINIFQSLNYFMKNDINEALVEARDVDSKLKAINAQYSNTLQNGYTEDAFARLLMGILYEQENTYENLNDAYISYKKSLETYQNLFAKYYEVKEPNFLIERILALSKKFNPSEFLEFKKKYSSFNSISPESNKGNLYIIQYVGFVPEKISEPVYIPTPEGEIIKIVFPTYRKEINIIAHSYRITAKTAKGKEYHCESEIVHNITKLASEELQHRKKRIIAKSIARATGKYLVGKKQEKSIRKRYGDKVADISRFIYNMITINLEKADTRSWRSLPGKIYMGYLELPPEEYQISVEIYEGKTLLNKKHLGIAKIEPATSRLILCHTR